MTDMRRPIDRELAEQRERERPLSPWFAGLLRAHASGTLGRLEAPGGGTGLSPAQWGMYLSGCSAATEAAFRYRLLGQREMKRLLKHRLGEKAEEMARSDPQAFDRLVCGHCHIGQHTIRRLAALVVEEAVIGEVTTVMRVEYMGIPDAGRRRAITIWREDYELAWRRISTVLDEWVSQAVDVVARNYQGRPLRKRRPKSLT